MPTVCPVPSAYPTARAAGHAALLNVGSKGTCPSTSIEVAISVDAAGTEQWMPPCKATVPDQCVSAGVDTSSFPVTKLKICGPGKFSISRMSCDRHDYKAETYVHPTNEYTATDCKVGRRKTVQIHLSCKILARKILAKNREKMNPEK